MQWYSAEQLSKLTRIVSDKITNSNYVDKYKQLYFPYMCVLCLGKLLHIQEETAPDLIGTNSNKQNEQSWTRLIRC